MEYRKKRDLFYSVLLIAGVILWIGETWFFGWNSEPQSTAEKMLDFISQGMIIYGGLGSILNGLTISKDTIINTENVSVTNPGSQGFNLKKKSVKDKKK